MSAAAIVNPHAGAGQAGRRWPWALPLLRERVGAVEVRFTKAPGDAIALARELADAGCDPLIVAGGDGTLNEVVNGILTAAVRPRLAVLPLASGGDFARGIGLRDVKTALEALSAGEWRSIDAMRARFRGDDGAPVERYFLNSASVGLGAVAAREVRGWKHALPGRLRYLAAALPALAGGRSFAVSLRVDDVPLGRFEITTLAVANGQYQGGGIRIAPQAALDDGLADVTVVERVSLWEVTRHLPILYSGALYSHRRVRHWRGSRVRVEGEDGVPVELDGEPVGQLPLEAELLPRALNCILAK